MDAPIFSISVKTIAGKQRSLAAYEGRAMLNLKKARPGLLGSEAIKWNFTSFLVDPEGNVVERYTPRTEPRELAGAIEKLL
jgi:glutathione peroxidase-family protein